MENTIKAEELRLGNYVDVPIKDQSPFRIDAFESLSKTFIKVAMIHPIHGENFHPLTWYGDDLKPIPLTEEWLVNFGFEKCKEVNEVHFRKENLIFILDYNFISFFNVKLPNEIKYVHQLQNFYFALFAQELTLKIELDEKR
jgi:hypothetical protein